jgi:hypothetical protein
MKPIRAALVALVLAVPATPAHAALIGLIGGDIDPQSIFDPSFQDLELDDANNCVIPGVDGTGRYCAQYEILPDVSSPNPEPPENFILDRIDFRLLDASGEFFTHSDLFGSCEDSDRLCVDSGLSDLSFLFASNLLGDNITFGLSSTDSIHCFPNVPDCDAEFFSNDPNVRKVSIVAVNGVISQTAVPEPATLFLLGTGTAALWARRKRQKAAGISS